MGVGTSRLAYRARVRDGCCYGYTEGSYCIFKVFKPGGHWDQVASVGGVDVRMQQRTRSCKPANHAPEARLWCLSHTW